MRHTVKWSGLADSKYYEYIAKFCLPSWTMLPGEKFVIHDGDLIDIPGINIVPWEGIPNEQSKFIANQPKKKPWNFWRKMQSQVHAVRTQKDCDFLVLLDTDIEVFDFNTKLFSQELENLLTSGLVWATGQSQLRKLDAGFIIINMKHPSREQLMNDYEDIWESGKIYTLEKGYDGDAVESLFEKYPSYRLKNRDYGSGLHVYDLGVIHWGSKVPKELRAAWTGDAKSLLDKRLSEIVIKEYKNR